MATAGGLAFLVAHAIFNARAVGGAALVVALGRELYPDWDTHTLLRFLADLVLAGLLFALVVLVAIQLAAQG